MPLRVEKESIKYYLKMIMIERERDINQGNDFDFVQICNDSAPMARLKRIKEHTDW